MFRTATFTTLFAALAFASQAAPSLDPLAPAISAPAEAPEAAPRIAGYCDWVMTFEQGGGERPSWCAATGDDTGTGNTAPAARA